MSFRDSKLIELLEKEGFKPVRRDVSRQQIATTLMEVLENDPNAANVVDIRIIDSYYLSQLSEEGRFFADMYRTYKQGEKPPLDQKFTICFKYANNEKQS